MSLSGRGGDVIFEDISWERERGRTWGNGEWKEVRWKKQQRRLSGKLKKKKKCLWLCLCVPVHVDACWLTAPWGLCVFVLLLHRSGRMLDPLSEVLCLASLLLSLGPTNSPLCRGGRKREEWRRYVKTQMGDQERERERRKEDFRSYVMWACTAVLPKAISPNSNQHRHNKNTPAPREMYSLGYEHTTFLKGLFEKPDTIMIVFSSSNVWGWGEIKRDERDVSNGRKWWFLDGRVYHALSITDRIAGSLECRVSVCNKVTFLFHWQLMKTDPHCQIYALHLLTQVLYDRERRAAHNNKIQAEGKWEAGKYFTVQFAESIQGKAGRRQQHYWRQGITLCSFSVQTTRGQLLSGTIVS